MSVDSKKIFLVPNMKQIALTRFFIMENTRTELIRNVCRDQIGLNRRKQCVVLRRARFVARLLKSNLLQFNSLIP